VQWADAVLGNSLGRYEQALGGGAAGERGLPCGLQFASGALVELVEAAVRSAVPERAAGARSAAVRHRPRLRDRLGAWCRGPLGGRWSATAPPAENLYLEAIDRFGRTRLRVDLARAPPALRRVAAPASGAGVTPAISSGGAYQIFDSIGAAAFAERGAHRTAGDRRAPPAAHHRDARYPDRAGSADRPPRRRRRLQPADRRAAVPQPRHRRLPPAESLHQARHQLTRPACSRACRPAKAQHRSPRRRADSPGRPAPRGGRPGAAGYQDASRHRVTTIKPRRMHTRAPRT